jgi:formamidopyrimidine-DNA glycosylase
MPELPEVETIARELQASVPGRRIERVRVFRADALGGVPVADFADGLQGRTIERVSRRGKYLLFRLQPAHFLIGHLRMTGKFVLSEPLAEPHVHHRVWFSLDDGRLLIFQDSRCFGTLRLVARLADSPQLAVLGMDPLTRGFTVTWLAEALARSRAPLKNWLMDQSRIAGLGNIYVAEILFAAGLSPLRPADTLDGAELARLHAATRKILRKAIRKNGTTISDFARVDEKRGEFQNLLQVYGRESAPCPRCARPIARIVQQQRSTFYCAACQH